MDEQNLPNVHFNKNIIYHAGLRLVYKKYSQV